MGLQRWGKRALVETAMLGERLTFALVGRPEASSAILVAGSGRSGTTWLLNMIAAARGIQAIFEPLFPGANPAARRLAVGGDRGALPHVASHYLRPKGSCPEWKNLLARALTGRVRSYWTDFERTSLFPSRFAIKMIRANLMLGYVHEQFRPTILFVTRHPCAVVRARAALGWTADVQDILCQRELVADHLADHVDAIAAERDPLGAHAVWWAVENLVASRQLANRPHIKVSYEALCLRPVETFGALKDRLDLRLRRPIRRVTGRYSRLGRKKHARLSVHERLSLWRKQLDPGDQRRVLGWARRLGVRDYDDGLLPLAEREELSECLAL